jgi:hypothetical protein
MTFTAEQLTTLVLEQAVFWRLRSVPARIRPDPEGLLVMHYIVRKHHGIGGRVVRERVLDEARGNYALAVWAEEDDLHVRASQRFSRGSPNDQGWIVVDPSVLQAAALVGYGLCYALRSRRLAAARAILNGMGLPMDENSEMHLGFAAPTFAARDIDEGLLGELAEDLPSPERALCPRPEWLPQESRRHAPPARTQEGADPADPAGEAAHG